MPIYDYQCGACETVFEAEHAMSERPRLRCPKCRSGKTSKMFNAASVQFKTGGFYVTDSRPKPADSATDSDSGTKTEAAKPEAKSDTKPEAKKAEPVAAV